LKKLIERVRKARGGLTSGSEEAVTTSAYGSEPSWSQSYDTWGARFQMQGTGKFLGVIDGIMHTPFRVGSDGTTCWLRIGADVTALPAQEIAQKNLLFADPFAAGGGGDADRVIREMKLEYLGEAVVRGRRCYRVRSWAVALWGPDWLSPVRDWSIDAVSLLPLRLEELGDHPSATDYTHTRVNQPIPDAEFRPEAGPGLKAAKADPLEEGYTKRFLTVNDGSSGRMSVRWGMQGPKGTKSGGLN
jgi:hypothetical protein